MLSVEPILERTFFRSGAAALLVGRSGLGAALGLVAAFAGGFFASAAVVEVVVVGLVAAGLGLGRLVAAPGTAVVLVVVVVVVEVVALLFTVLPAALLGRARSADGDFAVVFLASAGFASVLMDVGLLGGEAVVLFAPAVAVTGEVAVVRVAVVLLAAARGADDGGFESEVLLSGLFASVTFGLISFGVRVEGRVALLAGRLGVVVAGGPAVGLVGFL